MAKEIISKTPLCKENGKLNPEAIGWARDPFIHPNVKGSFGRKKKWNYWCVTNDHLLFSATISDIDYAASLFVYIYDRETKAFAEETVLIPLSRGIEMPVKVLESVQFKSDKMTILISEDTNQTKIHVKCPDFGEQKEMLTADLMIQRQQQLEALHVVIPWSEKHFQYTAKQPALPTQGKVDWGENTFIFDSKDSFACLDFGRGKWPYKSKWNWGSASGYSKDNDLIGINIGGQWTDGTGQNENGIIVNGQLHKIHDDMEWEYNKDNWMQPWKMKTRHTNQVNLTFTPEYERVAATNAIIIQSEVHQLFGTYTGNIKLNGGQYIQIENLFGWAEDHIARW
ncbi:DUF2804 domain-containing protein [Gracilibacillus kekensis]|uniref:DUF2804 domain-containing protein n=1 Tax=Gracilibacillus kekensis TaxID=1027249 RepID=A0A1M7JUR1_9BACI|nr:DUF2804 domain-containing protein [Gracilibacillus kekensis]SHM56728.1 Protein of unknown function [Gracilibacillus kekensis]